MKTGRNDPCPCGSGKKYKKCCLPLDRTAGALGDLEGSILGIARRARVWQTDIRPVPMRLDDQPESRAATVLVMAGEMVVDSVPLVRPSPEPDAMAEVLEAAILRTAERLDKVPETIEVRHQTVVKPLAERLAAHGIESRVTVGGMAQLDDAVARLIEHLTGAPPSAFFSRPETWAGWGLPPQRIEQIFEAAASFYRAAPWERLANEELLEARSPSGMHWTAGVLGAGGEEFGLNLYESRIDVERICRGEGPELFRDLVGRIVALSFESGSNLPRTMRREIARQGWEVAGAAAYPELIAYNSPAGGLLETDAEDLLALLGAVPRFLAAGVLESGSLDRVWKDPESGFELVYQPFEADWELEDLIKEPVLVLHHSLGPGDAEGPAADPEAPLRRFEDPVGGWQKDEELFGGFWRQSKPIVNRFARHLAEVEGLSSSTVGKHTRAVQKFVDYLTHEAGVPLTAVHARDLCHYLWRWHPRNISHSPSAARTVPASLARFFTYLASEEGIVCAWADEILADRESIEARWGEYPEDSDSPLARLVWLREGSAALRSLLLLPEELCADSGPPEVSPGSVETRLEREIERRWLVWRDEILRSKVSDPRDVLTRLLERQAEWEKTPQPALGGKTPSEAITGERRERMRNEDQPSQDQPLEP